MAYADPKITAEVLFAACAFVWGILPLTYLGRARGTNDAVGPGIVGSGAVLLLASAVVSMAHGSIYHEISMPLRLGIVPFLFHIDRLAAWFLALIAVAALAITPYLNGYLAHMRKGVDLRRFWICLPWLLLSMALVPVCANAICFLVFWEVMSLTSFLLVAADDEPHGTRHAALVYLGSTRIGTGLLSAGFLWAHAACGSWNFLDWRLHGAAALGPGLLVLCGLGVKAGMWPFHLWLPLAHPTAPAPVSALMSGVMVKVAVAWIARLFVLTPAFDHPAFGYLLLILGAIAGCWGILFALVQDDLKRLLAFSTVENVGLILVGLGGSAVARSLGMPWVAQVALAAALFHAMNHMLFKSLLFLGAGAVDIGAGGRDLNKLGGIGQRMPWTYACFTVGAAAICGLPPLNGFAGEWLLYQGSLRIGADAPEPILRFAGLLMIGLIALVGALSMAVFTKAVGVAFMGRPRSTAAERAHEGSAGMRVSQTALAAGCVLLGLCAPLVLRILSGIVAAPKSMPLTQAWTVPLGAATLVMTVTALAIAAFLGRASRSMPARVFVTWDCGFGNLGPRAQVAATSFVQPIARMFRVIFRYVESVRIEGHDRRLFPEQIAASAGTESILEMRVWRPAASWFSRAADKVLRLQEGSIHRYLITMFATLLILLAIGGLVR